MYSLRFAIVTLVVFTQVWTPVLAQTLPISVDKNVPGQRPIVGVSGNGVPIVNIAPPSAGGVSNNRFTQFNVGPSGVVLNNSGSGSQSQLAGGIGGNPMLGNSHATTILNQVTGNNPSQLRGFMEVTGNRANVIVANPAGITCDGCGFLNVNRGTLTTGLPILGADGSVQGFDVTRGRLSVEGKGLYGDNLDQVDLIARSLALNASVWANRLNLVAGPATVGYNDGSVQAKAGADAAPAVSLDMAALGGMYANSIRLIGTEAGVGVNIGGNLAAMTGDLQVTAAGDVRILPAGKVQAAGNLQMDSARAMTVDGTVAAGGDVRLNAAGDVAANNAISAVGNMAVNAGGNLTQGGAGRMQANSSVVATAGGAMALSGVTASQGAIGLQSRGGMAVDGLVSAGRDLALNAGGNLTQGGNGRMETNGALSGSSAGAIALSGTSIAQGAIGLQSSGGLALGGQVSAGGNISLDTAGNLAQVAGASMQTNGGLAARAGGAMALAGSSAALGDVALQSLAGMAVNGQVASGRNAVLNTTGDMSFGTAAKVQSDGNLRADATGNMAIAGLLGTTGAAGSAGAAGAAGATGGGNALTVHSGQDMSIAGTVSANTPLTIAAGRNLRIDGSALATGGDLAMTSGQDTTLGTAGRAQATGNLSTQVGGNLATSGILASNKSVRVNATGDARVDGTIAALGADLSLTGGNDVSIGTAGRVQAATTLAAQAGRDMALSGALSSVGNLTLTAARDATVNGIASTNAALDLKGRNLNLGSAAVVQSAIALNLDATGQLTSAGKIVSDGAVALRAAGNLSLSGTTASVNGNLSLASTAADVVLGASAQTQAAGMLNAIAARDLSLQGTTSSNGGIALNASRDLALGGITAALGGDLRMDAGGAANVAANGRAQASGAFALNTGGALNNDGLLSGGQSATLHADGNLTNRGTVVAANDVNASTSGALNNSGRFLGGLDDQGQISLPGNLTLSAGTLTNTGLAAAGGNATLNASSLLLAGGTVSATQALNATTAGAIDARGATLYGGTMSLTGASLDNGGGNLSASGNLSLSISGVLNNQSGSIATNGTLQAGGSQIVNQGGKMIAQDLNLTTPGAINNAGGLLQASNTLTLSAASLANTDTPSTNPAQPLGVVGKTVNISAATIDNTRGTLAASDALTVGTSLLQNASGLITSGGTADITAGTLANDAGNLVAGQRLSVTTNALTGTGTLQSQGDLGLTVNGSLNNTSVLAAGRDATLAIAGDLDNSGKISAGRNLTVGTRNLTNRATGEIVSNGITTLNVAQALDNAGLIDGHLTHIQAGSVHNTGRIYGDTLAISTGYLLNDVGAAGAGVIAARGDMDLAVGTLDNLEHALIYAAGDLSIGGALEGNWKAVGQAGTINNASATIQADGNASIAAGTINNKNNHFSSEVVQVSSGDKVYYRLNGSTDMLDGSVYWLCDQTTAQCSKDPNWLEDDQERRLLLPSATYPEDHYGPPFTYSKGGHGKAGYSAPITIPFEAEHNNCQGPDDNPCIQPDVFNYGLDAPIWAVFGVQPPSGPLPPKPIPAENCTVDCDAMQLAYDQAHAAYVAAFEQLNDRVLAFNKDYENRLVKDFTIYEVTENVSESRTLSTDPGKIIIGGNASLSGAVINDKSQIVAGGALNISGPAIQNIGATGERRVDAIGQEIYTYEKNDDRKYDTLPYSGTITTQPIELAVASYGGNMAPPVTGISAPGATATVSALHPTTITSVSLPGSGIVRTVTPPSSVPNNQLYTVVPAANSPYLVATDSRFTGQKPTISSDYLLALLGAAGSVSGPGSVSGALSGLPSGSGNGAGGTQSPTQSAINSTTASIAAAGNAGGGATGTNPYLQNTDTLKRLGDGFYEQKLVTDQIIAATGQRFVGDYTDNETQYKDLLTAGATFAQQYGLQVGTPLSDDQMKHLTSDMVWLVDQTVTLPDGSTQTVLVPQVYLVVQDGDLKGDGTLMAGSSTSLQASGNITNTGTVGSRDATVMVAENIINNSAGTIQGGYVNLNARQDLDNIAALIKGDTVALQAGRDVNLTSTTASASASTGPANTWSTYVSGVSQVDAGSLVVTAGNNLNITAASVNADNDARLQAGNDINLLTLQTEQGESVVYGKKNNSEVQRTDQVGSNLNTGGNLALIAGQDVNATAANASAGGQLGVQAGRDINLLAGEATGYANDEHYQKTKGHWGSTSTSHSIDTGEWTQAQSSTLTGDSVLFLAGRDVNVIGSNVGAVRDATISGDRNVTIAAAENTSNDNHYQRDTRSGWGALGGLSKGNKETTDTLDGTTVFHTGSTVGSVQGDLLINAGENLQVIGSNVVAREGDIGMVGRNVTITSVTDTDHEKEFHEVKQSGFSITVDSPVIEAAKTIDRMTEASDKTDNPIMQALAVGTMGLATSNATEAVTRSPGEGGGGSATITINYGASRSSSTTTRDSATVVGSTVAAGNDLTIVSTGAGKDSDITVIGSTLSAGNNAILKADGDILVQAASNTSSQRTDSKSIDGTIGAGVMVGADDKGNWGYGFIVKGSVSANRSMEDGDNLNWTNSSITAGNILALSSGGDTSLIGASGKANQILASIGGDLLMQSLQDQSTYHSTNQSASAGGTFCYGYCSSSAYASYSQGELNSDFKTVTQQTGLWAGDGGFQIDVKGNTALIGSVIASSDKAIADGLNQLSTGTLITKDIHNTANYDGYQVGVGGGYSSGSTQQTDSSGSTRPSQGGASASSPTFAVAFGSDKSTTESAISAGNIVIRDAAGQAALTGKSVAETIASLNRDTSDTLNSLSPIFDKEKVQAGFEIVTTAQQQVATFLSYRDKDIADLLEKSKDKNVLPADQQAAAAKAAELQHEWGASGEYRIVLNAILTGVGGNVSGSVGDMLRAGAINYFQSLSATQVKNIADALGKDPNASPGSPQKTSPEAEAARAALHALVGCAGAAASSAACSAGAMGAAAGSVINSLLGGDPKGMSPQEQEDRRNLVTSIVEGIALVTGRNVAAATSSAITETENNYLKAPQIAEYVAAKERLKNCKDSQCREEAKAELVRLDKVERDQGGAVTEKCNDNASCAVQIDDLNKDIAALEELAKTATGAEADLAKAALKAANYNYGQLLLYIESRAAQEFGPGFQRVSDDQLISGGYLTAPQVADLRATVAATDRNMAQQFIDAVVILMSDGIGRVGAKAGQEIAEAKRTLGRPVSSGTAEDASGFWSTTKSKSSVENAYGHWEKHMSEFPEYSNSLEYVRGAQNFISSPPSGTLSIVRSNGDVVLYNPTSNTLAVKAADGTPKTMFRPDPAEHGYPTNLDYFNAQAR